MFGKRTAQKLDSAAKKLYDTGTRIAGEPGGRVADAIANVAMNPIRNRCNTPCTRTDCTHD